MAQEREEIKREIGCNTIGHTVPAWEGAGAEKAYAPSCPQHPEPVRPSRPKVPHCCRAPAFLRRRRERSAQSPPVLSCAHVEWRSAIRNAGAYAIFHRSRSWHREHRDLEKAGSRRSSASADAKGCASGTRSHLRASRCAARSDTRGPPTMAVEPYYRLAASQGAYGSCRHTRPVCNAQGPSPRIRSHCFSDESASPSGTAMARTRLFPNHSYLWRCSRPRGEINRRPHVA
jgi:hypothetical protein